MAVEDKVILTCALSGVSANRQQCPSLPYTPDELAEEARRAREAGAAVVHVRARNPGTGAPVHEVDGYRAVVDAIRARVPDVLLSFSTSAAGISREQRVAPSTELRPELTAVSVGSLTYAIWSKQQRRFQVDSVQGASFADVSFIVEALRRAGVKPDHMCFDAGHVASLGLLREAGQLDERPQASLVLGVHGGAPASVTTLAFLAGELPAGATWQVVGVRQPDQWRMVAVALALGGSVRVGLEDNFYVSDGVMATSNGQLVEKAARMADDVGRVVAEPDEARRLLRIVASQPAKVS